MRDALLDELPRALARLPGVRRLPWPGPLGLLPRPVELGAAEAVLNRLFEQQLDDGDLDFLERQALRIRIDDLGWDWLLEKVGARLRLRPGRDEAAATFRGASRELLLVAARREDPDTLFFQRRLVVEGDTELGLRVKNLLDSVDMDSLPRAVGRSLDMAADFVEALHEGERTASREAAA
jgi:predicted lipid carrier protein YhbT